MRNVGRIKLGYYPLPDAEGIRLRNLLQYPAEDASILDPCVGTGAALLQLTGGAPVSCYGVELDADRAHEATAARIKTVQGNLFDVEAKVGSFSVLYLNPPYDSEVGSMDNKRMEYLFLEHTYRWLVYGGVLLMVVPHKQLDACTSLLAANFTSFRVFRLTDPESGRFDQVALIGIRKKMAGEAYQRNRELLVKTIWTNPLRTLTGEETPCTVPATPPAVLSYRGLPLDQLEDLAVRSSSWKKVEAFLLPKEEMAEGRPITPLHGGHVGLLCTAGLLNGVFGQGNERHIARWRTVKSVTTFEVEEDGYKEVHKRERFSNELALIYEDGRTLVLTEDKKDKEKKDAERTLAAGAA
jgi:tRNA1(Val) A37 N6-methylase TrmN6